jgi:hypothetical protein
MFYISVSTGTGSELQAAHCRWLKLIFFLCRMTPTIKSGIIVAAHIIFVLLCPRKELLHFVLHVHLQGQYSTPFTFLHCEKRKAEILRAVRNKHLINE